MVEIGPWTLVDLAVLGAVAGILPTCLGHGRAWLATVPAAAIACLLIPGSVPAVALAGVWPAVAIAVGARSVTAAGPLLFWTRADVVRLVAHAYGLVAAAWFTLSCAGATPLDIGEPIVELTAVHFTFVGVGALTLADAALSRARGALGRRVGWYGLVLTGIAPLVVAAGFATSTALPQVGGAVLMSLGVFCTAGLELAASGRHLPTSVRLTLAVSGLSVWAPMVLAVFWATSRYADVPALSVRDMVPAHGAVNAIGFVAAGLVARALEQRAAQRPTSDAEESAWI